MVSTYCLLAMVSTEYVKVDTMTSSTRHEISGTSDVSADCWTACLTLATWMFGDPRISAIYTQSRPQSAVHTCVCTVLIKEAELPSCTGHRQWPAPDKEESAELLGVSMHAGCRDPVLDDKRLIRVVELIPGTRWAIRASHCKCTYALDFHAFQLAAINSIWVIVVVHSSSISLTAIHLQLV